VHVSNAKDRRRGVIQFLCRIENVSNPGSVLAELFSKNSRPVTDRCEAIVRTRTRPRRHTHTNTASVFRTTARPGWSVPEKRQRKFLFLRSQKRRGLPPVKLQPFLRLTSPKTEQTDTSTTCQGIPARRDGNTLTLPMQSQTTPNAASSLSSFAR